MKSPTLLPHSALYKAAILLLIIGLGFSQCKNKKKDDPDDVNPYDKAGMISNWKNQVIVPQFQACNQDLDSAMAAFQTFITAKTKVNLNAARAKYIQFNLSYQKMECLEFGPSETEIIRQNFNTFPCDTPQIQTNISNGNYDLNAVANLDAKGLPALDYLFYGDNSSDSAIVQLFDTHTLAANRITYVQACFNDMKNKLNTVLSSWNGSYSATFTASTGNENGGAISNIVNAINQEVDHLKRYKLGNPMGKYTLGTPMPNQTEGYYSSQYSIDFITRALQGIEAIYLGKGLSGTDGLGLDDYLTHLGATGSAGDLNSAIKNQFAVVYAKLNAIPAPLKTSVSTQNAACEAAYLEIQKLLVYLKTEMPSALGIVINYQDSDGD